MLLRGLLLVAAFACIGGGGVYSDYGARSPLLRLRGGVAAFAPGTGVGGMQKQRPAATVTKVEELREGEARPNLKREDSRLVLSEVAS